MIYKYIVFLLMSLMIWCRAGAQKPFTEGTITYKIKLISNEHKVITGNFTYVIKGAQIRKEMSLSNGFQDVILINCLSKKAYSLQDRNGRKYAIELSMADILKSQANFTGFSIKNEELKKMQIAGCATFKGIIHYKTGNSEDFYFTKDWMPVQGVTFERFPDAKFLPLFFSYTDTKGMALEFEAQKVDAGPIENAEFRIPPDYKLISHEELMELSK